MTKLQPTLDGTIFDALTANPVPSSDQAKVSSEELGALEMPVASELPLSSLLANAQAPQKTYDFSGDFTSLNGSSASAILAVTETQLVGNHTTDCGCLGCCARTDEGEFSGIGDSAGTGDAETTTTTSAPAQATLGEMADYLSSGYFGSERAFNLSGSGTYANNGVLHYNVTGFSNIGGAGTDLDGISAARATLVREAFNIYSEVLGIDFVETTSTDTSLVDFYFFDNQSGAYAGSYRAWSGELNYSYVNVSSGWSGGTSTYDDYTLQTIFHEIGHAMGLGHQGDYNGSASYASDALFEYDSWQASMMSYFSQNENTAVTASYELLQTPMSVDWMALNDLYGSQSYGGKTFGVQNAFTGDTVYGFNTNISSSVSDIWAQFSNYAHRTASTIVDGGGTDTLDVSGYSANQNINLSVTTRDAEQPSISDIGGRIGNLTLAEGTVIENAIGGSGNDTFIGNLANNVLDGRNGNDTFTDSAGSDTYLGGGGTDQVNFAGTFSSYTFDIAGAFLQVINVAIDLVESTVEWLGFADQTLSFSQIYDNVDTNPNTAPDAVDDALTVAEDAPLSGNVLSNDTDADAGDTLTVVAVNGVAASVGTQITLASGALLTLNADGTFAYEQNGKFDSLAVGQTAQDSFAYTIGDGTDQDTATVTLTIEGAFDNQGPTASNDSFATDESATLSGNVLSNDTDPDGGTLTVTAVNGLAGAVGQMVTLASGAQVTLNSNGTFDYDPNGAFDALDAGQAGSDTFSYQISDGQGGIDTATVQMQINGESAMVISTPVTIDFEAAIVGAYSGDYGLSFSGVTVGSGTNISGNMRGVADNATGDFSITATGEDFDLNGISLRSIRGHVNVNVQAWDDGVVVGSGTYRVEKNRPLEITFDGSFDSIDKVTFDGPRHYYLDDIELLTRTVVTPGGNLLPVAVDDQFSATEGVVLTGGSLLADNGAGADSDPDGDVLSVTSVNGNSTGIVTLASGAEVTFLSDGTFSYDQKGVFDALFTGQTATDQFEYQISDGNGGTDTAIATVTIAGSGVAPPQPVLVAVGFENGLTEDGFVFDTAQITTRSAGVWTGTQAAQSIGDTLHFYRQDGGTFDFESGVFTAVGGGRQKVVITGYLDGEVVGADGFRIRDSKELNKVLTDGLFDGVDEVTISANGGVIVDDLMFLV